MNSDNIQSFWAVGINYKKTDASVRGLFAVNNDQYMQLLSVAPQYGLKDLFIVSTCNRTEVYGLADSSEQITNFLCSVTAGDAATFQSMGYAKSGYDAISHLFHVAAGLDSQILGDFEILGQIKNAVKFSKSQGFIGAFTERLLNSVLQCSKSIKTNTMLSGGTVSVSFAAIQCIREYFHSFLYSIIPNAHAEATELPSESCKYAAKDVKIVLVGTGKIGRTTCKNLVDYLGTGNITLLNRTEETAIAIAQELGVKSAPMSDLSKQLATADVILVSTSAAEPVILREHLEGKGGKLVIDMSVPCNVATDAQHLPGVTFVNVDSLSKIKDETLHKRIAEIPKAKAIIEEHIAEFKDWNDMRRHVPVLKEVKNKLREIHIAQSLLICLKEIDEQRIQKVVNTLALNMRRNNHAGCNYIQAINEYIA